LEVRYREGGWILTVTKVVKPLKVILEVRYREEGWILTVIKVIKPLKVIEFMEQRLRFNVSVWTGDWSVWRVQYGSFSKLCGQHTGALSISGTCRYYDKRLLGFRRVSCLDENAGYFASLALAFLLCEPTPDRYAAVV
jgi:hypothetical protein